ncbi:GDP-mannose 4,6-dehydratase [Tahibacter soli]|uniref:GDP-mannose 4,6-dehydratase n=1 Tax=Tahibacter soli TaxID=2983605 RepID=A0A9X3YK44_9GAMM|nr:GDP-mannose 4,6-dehydratase [Tahibacter soli]MDC8013851.1 GDP-mannose 4,6-dehydratase [Tahibacter soli]
MSAPLAIVTGATGQDGAYLCRALLDDGWRVCGTRRAGGDEALWRLRELGIAAHPWLDLRTLDLADENACDDLVATLKPAQVFHLAAVSSVAAAFEAPLAALAASGTACANLLDAMRRHAPDARLVYASSAELFDAPHVDESVQPRARSPYAFAKLVGHAAVQAYRASYGVHASAAILFNHESPLRGAGFVTRKIAATAARVARGSDEALALGNLSAQRDFGYAPDYVAAMRAMAARDAPSDYVLATGVATSVRVFVTTVYAAAGIALRWSGAGIDERAHDAQGVLRVRVDPGLLRPLDAAVQRGDAAKARRELGFAPSLDIAGLARTMLDAELRRLAR